MRALRALFELWYYFAVLPHLPQGAYAWLSASIATFSGLCRNYECKQCISSNVFKNNGHKDQRMDRQFSVRLGSDTEKVDLTKGLQPDSEGHVESRDSPCDFRTVSARKSKGRNRSSLTKALQKANEQN